MLKPFEPIILTSSVRPNPYLEALRWMRMPGEALLLPHQVEALSLMSREEQAEVLYGPTSGRTDLQALESMYKAILRLPQFAQMLPVDNRAPIRGLLTQIALRDFQ